LARNRSLREVQHKLQDQHQGYQQARNQPLVVDQRQDDYESDMANVANAGVLVGVPSNTAGRAVDTAPSTAALAQPTAAATANAPSAYVASRMEGMRDNDMVAEQEPIASRERDVPPSGSALDRISVLFNDMCSFLDPVTDKDVASQELPVGETDVKVSSGEDEQGGSMDDEAADGAVQKSYVITKGIKNQKEVGRRNGISRPSRKITAATNITTAMSGCVERNTQQESNCLRTRSILFVSILPRKGRFGPWFGCSLVDSIEGPYVRKVAEKGPTDLRFGDIIVGISGEDVRKLKAAQVLDKIRAIIKSTKGKKKIDIAVKRFV